MTRRCGLRTGRWVLEHLPPRAARFFAAGRTYFLEEMHPRHLLVNRFDVGAKHLFARSLQYSEPHRSHAERVYAEHLTVWNGLHEDTPPKEGLADFVSAFQALLDSMTRHGFAATAPVPIDRRGFPLDGGHRIAAALLSGTPVLCVRADIRVDLDFGFEYFANRRQHVSGGLSASTAETMATELIGIVPEPRAAVIFPAAGRGATQAAVDLLNTAGQVLYRKRLWLMGHARDHLIRHLYMYDSPSWFGDPGDGYPGIVRKRNATFPNRQMQVDVIFVARADDAALTGIKREIRHRFGGQDACHIGNTAEEAQVLARFALHGGSLAACRDIPVFGPPRFESLMRDLENALPPPGLRRDAYAIETGAVLAAYGLRDCADIDYIAGSSVPDIPPRRGIDRHELGVSNGQIQSRMLGDPAHHFFLRGVKFATLDAVREAKVRRGSESDERDVRLIDVYRGLAGRTNRPAAR